MAVQAIGEGVAATGGTAATAGASEATAAEFDLALASARGSPSDRLAAAAISMSGYATNYSAQANAGMPGTIALREWLAQPEGTAFPGYDKISMNCFSWVLMAGIKAGVVDRSDARDWLANVETGGSVADKNRALFGDNPSYPIDVSFRTEGGRPRVASIEAHPSIKPGDIITIDGTVHVLMVTGRTDDGSLTVASFPTIVLGDGAAQIAGGVKPYAGTLEGFLDENLRNFAANGETNYFLGSLFRGGRPGFLD